MKAMDVEAMRILSRGPAAVAAGAEVAVEYLQAYVPLRTGGLMQSIKAGKVKRNSIDGVYCDVGPTGKDKHGEPYEKIGNILEYGRSNMPARSWVRTAVERGGSAVAEAMRDELMKP